MKWMLGKNNLRIWRRISRSNRKASSLILIYFLTKSILKIFKKIKINKIYIPISKKQISWKIAKTTNSATLAVLKWSAENTDSWIKKYTDRRATSFLAITIWFNMRATRLTKRHSWQLITMRVTICWMLQGRMLELLFLEKKILLRMRIIIIIRMWEPTIILRNRKKIIKSRLRIYFSEFEEIKILTN